ncbi:hypothetical protein ABZ671_13960 [Micromonospora sp. NPDC006766]|uniref:hypothetical protein n=1 Tax=Micromonospora sp. NPDC006766 TaxID=3154778 RepID=UPI0033C77A14
MSDNARWPAAIGAIAAMLGVVVAAAAYLWPREAVPQSSHQPQTTTLTTADAAAPATAQEDRPTPTPTPPPPPKHDVIRWQGRITINTIGKSTNGTELDPVPPHPGNGTSADISSWLEPGQISGKWEELNLAEWTGSAFPTPKQCSDQIDANPVMYLRVRKGSVVCVRTAEGRIAALKLVKVSAEFLEPHTADATIWELP